MVNIYCKLNIGCVSYNYRIFCTKHATLHCFVSYLKYTIAEGCYAVSCFMIHDYTERLKNTVKINDIGIRRAMFFWLSSIYIIARIIKSSWKSQIHAWVN